MAPASAPAAAAAAAPLPPRPRRLLRLRQPSRSPTARLMRTPLRAPPAPAAAQDTGTVVEETAGPLSPLVRKMARENNIDLSQVKGTGAGGRITKQDLEAYLAGQTAASGAVAPVPAAVPRRPRHSPGAAFRRRLQLLRPPPAPAASRSSARNHAGSAARHARRAHEHHAPEDRRAHGVQQAHLGACDHGSQGAT